MGSPREMQDIKSDFESYWYFISTENFRICKVYLFTLFHLKQQSFEETEVVKTYFLYN